MRFTARASLLTLLVLAIQACVSLQAPAPGASDAAQRWRSEVQNTTIVRDDWGIAHIHGKTDRRCRVRHDLRAGRG